MGDEARQRLEEAENQLSVAENASRLAKAHVDIYHARMQIIGLERMISKIQAEKDASSLSRAFLTADLQLKQAQAKYAEAKMQLADVIKKEEYVRKTVNAENRQIKAKMDLMAAIKQLEGTQKDVETIFREAQERRQKGILQDETELFKRELSAKTMLEIATAAKEAAEMEFREASAAKEAVLEAIQRECEESCKEKGEKDQPFLRLPGDTADEIMAFEDTDDDWEAKVWGFDPADEEEDEDAEGTMPLLYEAEVDGDDEDNEGEGKSIVTQREKQGVEDDQHHRTGDADRQEAAPDGAWRSSEESGKTVKESFSGDPQKQLQALLFHKKTDTSADDTKNGSDHVDSVERTPVSFSESALKSIELDHHSWPIMRARERARRQKVMEIHHRQFPPS